MVNQKTQERITLWLTLALFAAAAINLNIFYFRWDLTSAGAYTVSQASKDLVAQAKENIYVTYYASKKLFSLDPVFQSLSDFLAEYAAGTGGRVKLKVVDPQEAKLLDEMQKLGIQGNPINVVEENQATQSVVYSGLLIEYLDKQEVIPLISQMEIIEYEISAKISKLLTNKSKIIGVLNGNVAKSTENSYSYISKSLGQLGEVRFLNPGEIPDPSLSLLIVAGAKSLEDYDAYQIDQFIMNGGKVLFAVDGVNVDMNNYTQPAVSAENQPVNKLLESYGIKIQPQLVADVYSRMVQVNAGGYGLIKRYVLWPQIVSQDTSRDHPVTARFPGLDLMWASPVEVTVKDGAKAEPIVWSSPKSWVMKEPYALDPDMAAMGGQNTADMKALNVVWSLTGSLSSTYTQATVPRRAGETALPAAPKAKSPDTRVLVVGDADFLTDLIQMSNSPYNIQFLGAAVDWLAQDDALLGIKSRVYRDRTLNQLQDSAGRNTAAFFLSFVNIGLIPLTVLGIAIVRAIIRNRRELQG